MRIALVAQHVAALPGDKNGQDNDTSLVELSRSLARDGHQVTVYAQRPGDADSLPARAGLAPGVTIEFLSGPAGGHEDGDLLAGAPAFSRLLHDRWRRDRPDVAHAIRWTSGLAALAAARDLRIPVVQSFDDLGTAERPHQPIGRNVDAERARLEPAIGRSASAVLAGSGTQQSDLARLGVPRRSIRVVPRGIDVEEFAAEGPVAGRGSRPLLVTVAELTEYDALATLLYATACVPGAELVVAGGPPPAELDGDPDFRRLSSVADALGVSARVSFAGQVGRGTLPPLLRSADLTVCVSDYDPSGLLALRSMACGTPVIACAAVGGGQLDAVLDGTTGFLVRPGSPVALTRRIRQLLSQPMLLEAFGVAAADRARSRYSWDRIARETAAVYDTARGSAAAAAA